MTSMPSGLEDLALCVVPHVSMPLMLPVLVTEVCLTVFLHEPRMTSRTEHACIVFGHAHNPCLDLLY